MSRVETSEQPAAAPAEPNPGRERTDDRVRVGLQTLGIGTFLSSDPGLLFFRDAPFLDVFQCAQRPDKRQRDRHRGARAGAAVISGGFDLSVSGTLPLGAVTFAMASNGGLGTPLSLALAVAIGAFVGLINGLIVTKLLINPLITTLGTLSISVGLAFTISKGVTIPFADIGAGVLADKTFGGLSYYLVAFALLSVAPHLVLRFTVFGRMLYAIGGNREASRLAGMRVDFIIITVYVLCGSLAAFAGVVVASQLFAGSATVGTEAALSSIAAVVLGGASLTGGVGGIPGTLIGVLVLGTIANGMVLLQVPAFYQQTATGVILLLGVGFARLRELAAGEQ